MTTEVDYTTLTNEELLEAFDKAWLRYMYYQAAEGNWAQETEARNQATEKLYTIEREVKARGLSNEG